MELDFDDDAVIGVDPGEICNTAVIGPGKDDVLSLSRSSYMRRSGAQHAQRVLDLKVKKMRASNPDVDRFLNMTIKSADIGALVDYATVLPAVQSASRLASY